ncbi:MAG: hypothetical protein GX811_05320, partial [Lentisphaerae bacterium]|nr:hypothetical protein [Lentisphaerota bacterium]
DVPSLFKYVNDKYPKGDGIVEDWIIQHESISRVYGKAVNPIRIVTIASDNRCDILRTAIIFGSHGEIANAMRGGMVAIIDTRSGVLVSPAQNVHGEIFEEHPLSGMSFVGFKIPYWEETIKMVKEASKVVPEVGYVGWDVAVTPNGPILIEGNSFPGYYPYGQVGEVGKRALYDRFL